VRGNLVIVEDNEDLAFGLQASLEVEGYQVRVAGDGRAGLEAIDELPPDLVVLDLMLPDQSGYDVLRRLRQAEHTMPVLILSAKGEEVDKVQGFRLGADDYVVKPVGVMELLARVEALLRRAAPGGMSDDVLSLGEMAIDRGRRLVTVGTGEVDLSPMEFDLLTALALRAGRVVTRAQLLKEVWGYRSQVESRTVDTHVAKLRAKLDRSGPAIVTVRKIGYRLDV